MMICTCSAITPEDACVFLSEFGVDNFRLIKSKIRLIRTFISADGAYWPDISLWSNRVKWATILTLDDTER